MNFLLDANAVSEWVKPRPNAGLIRWMEEADEDRVFLSVISLAELHYGVERMAVGARRWLRHELPLRFEGRILSVDHRVAEAWGRTVSRSEAGPWARWTRSYRQPRDPSPDIGDTQCFWFFRAESGSESLELVREAAKTLGKEQGAIRPFSYCLPAGPSGRV